MSHLYAPLPVVGADPPAPPAALHTHPVVIVGGGPVGLLAAAMMAQRSLSVILVERADLGAAATAANLSRAYSIALNARAYRVLDLCPGLMPRIVAASVASPDFRIDGLGADQQPTQLCVSATDSTAPFRFILRARLVALLYDYVDSMKNVTVLDHTELSALRFCADGTTRLNLSGRHRDAELIARLVLACDGRNSSTLAALREDTSGTVSSTQGLADEACTVPSSGKLVKSIVVTPYARETVSRAAQKRSGHPVPASAGVMLGGQTRGRAPDTVFSTAGLPVAPGDAAVLGGELGSVMATPDNALFHVRDVDSVYALLQENFPQLDAQRAFSKDGVQRFVDDNEHGAGWPLGPVRRVQSLVATVGRDDAEGQGGIVLLGEAAHSFPPDMGQGLNSGVEDVGVLAGVIDRAGPDACAGDVAREYERVRDADVDGLVFIHRVAARWQLGQPLTPATAKWLAGTVARKVLSSALPRVFDPPVGVLLLETLSYGEIMRRATRTTFRVWLALGLALGAVLVVVIALRS